MLCNELFLSIPTVYSSLCEVRYDIFHLTLMCQLFTQDVFVKIAAFRSNNIRKSSVSPLQERLNCVYSFRGRCFWNRRNEGSTLQTRTSGYLKHKETLLLRLSRTTWARGFTNKYPQWINSCNKRATANSGSARSAISREDTTSGSTSNGDQNAFMRILLFSCIKTRINDV